MIIVIVIKFFGIFKLGIVKGIKFGIIEITTAKNVSKSNLTFLASCKKSTTNNNTTRMEVSIIPVQVDKDILKPLTHLYKKLLLIIARVIVLSSDIDDKIVFNININ